MILHWHNPLNGRRYQAVVGEDLFGDFVGGLGTCTHWLEDLEGHGRAVNIVQPLSMAAAPARAQ